jgi:hypothetical protein
MTLSNSATTKRNEVIHKGKIPDRTEALEFGEIVAGVIYPQLRLLHHELGDSSRRVLFHLMRERQIGHDGPGFAMMSLETYFSQGLGDEGHTVTVAEYVSRIETRRSGSVTPGISMLWMEVGPPSTAGT